MADFPLQPINGHVLVEFEPHVARQTKSGFHIAPPKHEGVPNRGTVLALPNEPIPYQDRAGNVLDVVVGDYVFYADNAPNGFKWEGKKIIPIHKDDLLAVGQDD